MTIAFPNSSKKYLNKAFFVPNFCFFFKILQLDKIKGAVFKYDHIFCQIQAQKYSNKASLVLNLGFFFFFYLCQILQLDKIEGADFKYDNILCKL